MLILLIRLDVYVNDDKGTVYNVEMQREHRLSRCDVFEFQVAKPPETHQHF